MAYKMKNSLSGLCSSPLQNKKRKGSKQNENKEFKLNDPDGGPFQKSDDPKRGRVHIEQFQGDGLKNKNTDNQSSDGKNITAEANDFTDRKVNDPKGVLNRPVRKREYKKGYRYKEEKDGSLTLKGKKGN